MGELKTFFFDTYAFHEIIAQNPHYQKYTQHIGVVTTRLNLMELHYGLVLKYGKGHADKIYDWFLPFAVDVDDRTIKEANYFRARFKKRKFSYIDCIGYVIAKSRGVKFLTGDRQFEDLDNVEYVK